MTIDQEIAALFDMSTPVCKVLGRDGYIREWRGEHPQAVRRMHQKYRESHRELLREKQRAYYQRKKCSST